MDAQKLLDNFSTHLKNVIATSIALVASIKKNHVEPVHLLRTLVEEHGSIGGELLKKFSLTSELISTAAPDYFAEQPYREGAETVSIPVPDLSPASRSALEKALVLAHTKGHVYIGTEHLLHGLLASKHKSIRDVFTALNIDSTELSDQLDVSFQNAGKFTEISEVMNVFEDIQGNDEGSDEQDMTDEKNDADDAPEIVPPSLTRDRKKQSAVSIFTTLLTSKQHTSKLDPVIGREREIERMINILSRRTKNNPILVGEPGVGKTAIAEGLAKRIAEGTVPDILKRKKILSLDLTLLVAGTIYRGEFEARLKQIIDECASNPNYILFIDELHNIIGAGSNQGTMDAANILKPALARGQLRCIGATTYDEYKKYISGDPALERRFQRIDIEEPGSADVRKILEGIRSQYESYHQVNITDEALDEAVSLSNRYIHDNYQPDKSIDLIDEAASAVKNKQKTPVADVKLFALETKLEELLEKKNLAIAEERLKEAAKLKDTINALQKKIERANKQAEKNKKTAHAVLPQVSKNHVRDVLASKLHIDRGLLEENEWERLLTLAPRLEKHIIGQQEVLTEVAEILKMSELGIRGGTKPYASFLFTGPSGVGKTELAKQLAKELYSDDKAFIKLDMGEFSEGHSVSKLLGSPAGYIGYKDRNPFIEKIKQRPYSVLLFDEIDKAHPDVLKLLLQILDEGELTDHNGRKIKLTHSIVVLTSNIGAELYKSRGIGFDSSQKTSENRKALVSTVTRMLKERLSSALMSRLDAVCVFNQLTLEDIKGIVQKHVALLSAALGERQHISIIPDDLALEALVGETADKDLGARNIEHKLERIIEELVIAALAKRKKKTYTLTRKQDRYLLT